MGPAVTSEAVSCEREKRLRNTASLSPHNTHSDASPLTRMSTDESASTVECHGVNPCSSSQPVESSAGVLAPTSNGQTTCSRLNLSKVDNRSLSVSLKPHNANFVNIKDIQKVSIFFKNNACTMLPNGGVNRPSSPDETKMVQVSACDETVPCGTAMPQLKLVKRGNSFQSENSVTPGSKIHHTIVLPKSQPAEDAVKHLPLESEPTFHGIVAEDKKVESVSQSLPEELDSLRGPNRFAETSARQKRLNSQASRMLKRLRRLQCREVNSAVKEKLGQLVLSLGQAVNEKISMTTARKPVIKDTLGNRELTTLSTAELVSYVQKLQSSQQNNFSHRQPVSLGSMPTEDNDRKAILSDNVRFGMCRTSGQLLSNMRHLKSALDSDATESSSGGESGDEGSTASKDPPDFAVSTLTHKKLEYDWANERSSIVSRWTWLQAQVSDLEYRIRQQSDVYKQLRLSKGAVSLRDPACTSAGPSTDGDLNGRIKANRLNVVADVSSENQKTSLILDSRLVRSDSTGSRDRLCLKLSRTRQSSIAELLPDGRIKTCDKDVVLGGKLVKETPVPSSISCTSSAPSTSLRQQTAVQSAAATLSARIALPSSVAQSTPALMSQVAPSVCDPTCRAARCLEMPGLRRRTLLRTAGLHEVSRKASQLSTVRCACYPPVTPCALCGGRYDRVIRPGPTISTSARTSLLDPSYHPVLSFPQDVPLPLRMAESLWIGPNRDENCTKYSFRPATVRVKNRINSRSLSNELLQAREMANEESVRHLGHHIQSPAFRGRRSSLHRIGNKTMRKKKHLSLSRKHLSKTNLRSSSLKGNRSQLLRRGYLKDAALRRQSSRSTFDINNVVIPSHVTSAARLDFIQYKEIVTPKWRKIPKDIHSVKTGGSLAGTRCFAFYSAKRPRLSTSESDGTKKVHWSSDELDSSARHRSPSNDPCGDETDAEEEIENLSDEAFVARHLRYEIYEKKQCMPMNVGHQRRSRSNRSESDSYTLLNPQSPEAANQLDASASLTSSTLSGGPSTSCLGYSDAEDPGHHHGDGIPARQQSETKLTRSFSVLSWGAGLSASHSSEQLSEQLEGRIAQAWPPRNFPLGDFENELLFSERPENNVDHQGAVGVERSGSPAASTGSESTELADEDPNDPEWTVTARNKDKPGILIKFAKV